MNVINRLTSKGDDFRRVSKRGGGGKKGWGGGGRDGRGKELFSTCDHCDINHNYYIIINGLIYTGDDGGGGGEIRAVASMQSRTL